MIHALDVPVSIGDDRPDIAIDSLGELVSHYSQTVCVAHPTSVYDELLGVRSYAGTLIDRVGRSVRNRSDLASVVGWLSCLLAVVTCDMGDHPAALLWCADAERRSQEAGHPEIAAWATHTRVMIAFYQGLARKAVALAERGQHLAPGGSVVYAKLAAQEMRAWALLGNLEGMEQARGRAAQAMAKLSSDAAVTGTFSIPLAEDPPYTATSLLLVNRFHDAASATERVIETVYGTEASNRTGMPSSYARSLLILALAHAGLWRVDSAAAAGCAALESAPLVWPTMVLAGKLDRTLTRGFAGTAEVADYHARYVDATSRTARRRPPSPRPEDRA